MFRFVASNQSRTTLLSERSEKLEYITSQLPESFISKIESIVSNMPRLDDETPKLKEVNNHIDGRWEGTSMDIAKKIVSSYDSSSIGFMSIGDEDVRPHNLISHVDSFETSWYPRQIKLKLIYPENPEAFTDNLLGSSDWKPPLVLAYASQSYKQLDDDLDNIENSIWLSVWMTILAGSLLALLLGLNLSSGIVKVKMGISNLAKDLHKPIPRISGELGEIADSANKLALDLLQSKSRSERVLDAVGTGIAVLDSNLKILEVNPSMLKITGLYRKDILDQDIKSLGEIGRIAEENIKDVIISRSIWSSGAVKIQAFRGQRYYNMRAIPVDLGEKKEAILAISDVTESVINTLESERSASLARLGLFTSGIAHEVRNPLTSIKGFVQLLDSKVKGTSEQKYLGRINKEVVRLESLINELLSTVKQKPLERIRVDLSKIVNEVLSNELENLKNSNISVTKKFKPNIWVNVDEKRVYQVLLNLIINARDAMKDGGKLFVKTHSEGMWQTVEVIDSGNGISEDAATMIFTPFFTTKAEGTGLGLSICDEIIKAHGGRIAFSSDDLGTVFSIRLPRE